MPTFMDVHEGMHVTPQQLAEAHKLDVEAQKGTGVEYVRYWLDSKGGKGFCLAKGPHQEGVAAVHTKPCHPANELYEVSEGKWATLSGWGSRQTRRPHRIPTRRCSGWGW